MTWIWRQDFGGVTILVQNPLWVKIVWIICKFHQSFTLKANGMKVISRPQSTTQSVWWCLKPKNVMGNILPSDSAVDVNQETKSNLHNFISACYLPAQFLPSMQPPTLHSPQQDVRLAPLRRHVSPGRPHLNEPSKWVGGHSNSEDRGKSFFKNVQLAHDNANAVNHSAQLEGAVVRGMVNLAANKYGMI